MHHCNFNCNFEFGGRSANQGAVRMIGGREKVRKEPSIPSEM
jgi:hypothetical protein